MMPRLAALSMAEIIARTSFASGLAPAAETFFCIPRRRVRTLRLRRVRLVVWRARLEADRVLAMVKICEAGRVAESSRPVKAASPGKQSGDAKNYALRPKCGCSLRFFRTVRAGFLTGLSTGAAASSD